MLIETSCPVLRPVKRPIIVPVSCYELPLKASPKHAPERQETRNKAARLPGLLSVENRACVLSGLTGDLRRLKFYPYHLSPNIPGAKIGGL